MSVLTELLADLAAEGDRLRAAVGALTDAEWRSPTPAEGWDVATQISHLAWTDETSQLAARAAQGDQGPWDEVVLAAIADPEGVIDNAAITGARVPPAELLTRWDTARAALAQTLATIELKMPWFGPPMSPTSMATARLMETWAHGLDVYQGLGITPAQTDVVRHICYLGIRTRNYSFASRGLAAPESEILVNLTLPSGELASWGPADATQSVSGSAWDFARLITRRVHRTDTDLRAIGPDADHWLEIAQAFAGPAGTGREAAS